MSQKNPAASKIQRIAEAFAHPGDEAEGLALLCDAFGLESARLTLFDTHGHAARVLIHPSSAAPEEAGGPVTIAAPWGAPRGAELSARVADGALGTESRAALELVVGRIALEAANRALLEAEAEHAIEAGAIRAVSRELSWGSDLTALLDLALKEAARICRAEGGAVHLREPGRGELALAVSRGVAPGTLRPTVPLGYGVVGWVAANAVPLRAEDRGEGPEPAPPGGRRHHLAVPLVNDGEGIGVLSLFSAGPEPFTVAHERVLSVFAAPVSKAVAAARLIRDLRAERDLRENIVGASPNGVFALDADRRVVFVNHAARRYFAAMEGPGEQIGNPVERYLPHPPLLDALTRVLKGGPEMETVELSVGPKEEARHFQARIIRMGEGAARGATLILQDVTEQRRLDEHLRRMERVASIGQLAAGVAHEIRNPLTGIGITLDMLAGEPGLSAGGREMIADISREIDRLETLIRGLLDFARPQPAQRRPMRLAKALEWHRSFVEQCKKKGLACNLDLGANPKVMGDPELLKQLFLNLAINALDATDPGGEVRLRTDVARSPGGEERVVVEVSDTGRGMDAETVRRIFDPFFTTKNEGTGLGLSIAHSIAEQHGGRILVESDPGRGATFRVELPLHTPGREDEGKER